MYVYDVMLEIEQLLTQTLGLNIASVGHALIERSVRQRMLSRAIDEVHEYFGHLLREDGQELRELIECIVISETWFFRNHEALTTMVQLLTTQWSVAQHGNVRRILSIPCATGEEPYSIAIALAEAGLSHEQAQIDAVDISERALARAKLGIYGRNSFRGEASRVCEKYVRPVPGGSELLPTIRRWVRFAQGNLAGEEFHPPASCYDVIFCRNVLIYFDRPSQERALKTLHQLLASDGYLFVGPAEATLAAECGFQVTEHTMAFLCRKTQPGTSAAAIELSPVRPVRSLPAPLKPVPTHPARAIRVLTRRTPPRPFKATIAANESQTSSPPDDLTAARLLADTGRLAEAADKCHTYIRTHGPNAEVLYLLGLVHDARGATELAMKSYRKALFLDPEHAEASAQLAIHAQRAGDTAGAERLRARMRRIEGRGKP